MVNSDWADAFGKGQNLYRLCVKFSADSQRLPLFCSAANDNRVVILFLSLHDSGNCEHVQS